MADVSIPSSVTQPLQQLVYATQRITTSNIVAAMISAAGRPFTLREIAELSQDVHFTLYPDGRSGSYIDWAKDKDAHLDKDWSKP